MIQNGRSRRFTNGRGRFRFSIATCWRRASTSKERSRRLRKKIREGGENCANHLDHKSALACRDDVLAYRVFAWPWPTLRELIQSGQRVVVFIESGRSGVAWLRPAFQSFKETPFSFRKPDEFSCRANRGGEGGSLFLINNWVETTPTPKPSNASIVNAYSFLYKRAELCEHERHHMPNIIAVDFYRTGDLLTVVNALNGVGEAVPEGAG
jgi:hypothetical protein